MISKQEKFFSVLAPIVRHEYLTREKWILPSVCIAQASLESGYNLKAKTLFGIKGNGKEYYTKEYINGKWITVKAEFREYKNIGESVIGYFDFITNTPRYCKVVNNPDYISAIDGLIHTTDGLKYATAPNYTHALEWIIKRYNLTKYDKREHIYKLATEEVAMDVIRGKYGNGAERIDKLKKAGYKPIDVQNLVNKILNKKIDYHKIALDVIHGNYGNGAERKKKLIENGIDFEKVQKEVNNILNKN